MKDEPSTDWLVHPWAVALHQTEHHPEQTDADQTDADQIEPGAGSVGLGQLPPGQRSEHDAHRDVQPEDVLP
jgi:hypothetical protein